MSEYYKSLHGNVKARYEDKLRIVDYVDPYTSQKSDYNKDLKDLPQLTLIDIVNYFTLTHSFYTGKELKAFKSLEAYRFCQAGFVRDVCCLELSNHHFIITAEVRHSQRMNDKPLKSWLILLPDSTNNCVHCSCMAGLGEVCSHVAAVAFYLLRFDDGNDVSCTSKLSSWTVPKYKETVIPHKIRDIDWGNVHQEDIPPLEGDSLHKFLRKVEEYEPRAVIFNVMQPYAQTRVPQAIKYLPKSLKDLYDPVLYVNYSLEELRSVEIENLSKAERDLIQKETIEQHNSKTWFNYRAGRITGSLLKSVCKTSLSKPSLSLIKRICYALKMTCRTDAIVYGINNEKSALEAYKNFITSEKHENVKYCSVGLCISQQDSCIAATPDGMIQCDCCGVGCIEIKCPYRMLNPKVTIQQFAEMKNSYLVLLDDILYGLNRNHDYFYQVQLQMFVTETNYCDFVVWSKQELFVQRIYYDKLFIQPCIEIAKIFHSFIIVPELLVKSYTKSTYNVKLEIWCECGGIDDGRKMIRCANEDCSIKWFHCQCVNVKKTMKSTYWFCKTCSLNILADVAAIELI